MQRSGGKNGGAIDGHPKLVQFSALKRFVKLRGETSDENGRV
jgi:hypothetical protein